jgi:hypothetical protein
MLFHAGIKRLYGANMGHRARPNPGELATLKCIVSEKMRKVSMENVSYYTIFIHNCNLILQVIMQSDTLRRIKLLVDKQNLRRN